MVGAASGLGGKQKIEHKQVITKSERQVRAYPMLVLGTNDLEKPVTKIHFENSGDADLWNNRIEVALARLR